MGLKAPEGGNWSPARVANIVHHHCYNANARVPNPDRLLGDITAEIKRTLLRTKPEEEWVNFKVPALISEELWQKANANIAERGRGRGDICTWLRDDALVEQQLTSEQSQDENIAKLIRLHQFKISQAQAKIAKFQEGFEAGIYSVNEAKRRIADHRATIAKAEREIQRLQESMKTLTSNAPGIEAMREELETLRDRNLDEVAFEEKLDIISKLGIKVYPSEDLKSMKVLCQLNLEQVQSDTRSGKIGKLNLAKSQADVGCEPEICVSKSFVWLTKQEQCRTSYCSPRFPEMWRKQLGTSSNWR